MNKIRFTLKAFAFLVFALACTSAARAQATRTWVSGVGDDVNPCSRTAPCKTFACAQLFVIDTIINDTTRSGIRTQTSIGTDAMVLDNLRAQRNQDGYLAISNTRAQIYNSRFTQNNGVGISVSNSAGNVVNIQ